MSDTPTLLAFLAASAVLAVLPGPAVLFIVTRSVQHGRVAGLVSVLGIGLGGLVHVLAAVVGLSAIVAASAELFTAVKLVGAGYLVYLGIKTLTGPSAPLADAPETPERPSRLFVEGVLVNVFNPKPALFFLAFLPQFVDPTAGGAAGQLATLGLCFVLVAFVSDAAYALAAASLRGWLRRRPRVWRAQRYVSGTVYLGLGLSAALTGRRAG